jgi:hypothetical protein
MRTSEAQIYTTRGAQVRDADIKSPGTAGKNISFIELIERMPGNRF